MQYQTNKIEKLAGIFIFTALLLVTLFLVLNIRDTKLFSRRITLETVLDRGYGVSKGTVVKVNGLAAGMVESMRLDKNNAVWVTMGVSYPFYQNIRRDATAEILEPIAFGSTEINILPGSDKAEPVADGSFIQASVSTGLAKRLDDGFKKVEDTITEFNKTAQSINKATANVEGITGKIDKGDGTLGKLVNDSGLYDSAKQAIDSTQALGASFKELEELIKETKSIAERVDKIAANLESITAKIDRGDGSLSKMLNDAGLYDSAKDAVDSTRSIVESIKQTKIYVGLDENINPEYTNTRFHLKIVPRDTRYFWLGASIINPTDDSHITSDGSNPDGKVAAEFLVAQRLFDKRLTLKAGLMEGRFGGGLDYAPIPQKKEILLLTVEGRSAYAAADFNENAEDPIVRAMVRLKLFKYFHLDIGTNDILNRPGFFAGFGFEYMDEDISKIVGLIGAGK
ncbi:MAG: MlaD family protein [Candidatus Brocadiia bacterium]